MRTKLSILTLILTLTSTFAFAQPDVLISDNDYTATGGNGDCACSTDFNNGSVQNFHDTGGSTGDYSANENEVITFCPDVSGTKVVAAFGINAGYTFDVDPSDTLFIYDGPTTSSTILDTLNNNLSPNGANVAATWANQSGCLTIQFISDASVEGTGWDANISCSNLAQPFRGGMKAFINGQANGANDTSDDLNPSDTGYVDVCLGDSVMYVADPYFPYEPGGDSASTNGGGYNQSNNHTSEWTFSDGSQATGDTVWFVPPARQGYYATLKVTDSYGIFKYTLSKLRVSTIPSFATCRPLDDSLCFGEQTELVGGVSALDTAGVDPSSVNFPIGGVFGAQTYLPDGSGQNYTTDIDISGFTPGGTVQNATDIDKICISIEHSYLGDLEMMLTCPNGQSVDIFNSYTGNNGLFPGGFGGGNTFLGGAYDNNTGTIGVCEEYCFSDMPGALPSWDNGYPTVPASGPSTGSMVAPGTYNPEESFVPALQGCPINGTWTITVRDNLSIDDGYICEWGIYFNDSLNPNSEYYAPEIVSDFWHSTPDIILDNDTTILIQPDSIGTNHYTFEVLDTYGCSYDTTITVVVSTLPTINIDTNATCNGGSIQFSASNATYGGTWSASGPGNMTFTPSTTSSIPVVSVDENGMYIVSYTDNKCNITQSDTVYFINEPTTTILYNGVAVDSITICADDEVVLNTQSTDANSYYWNLGSTADSIDIIASDFSIISYPEYLEYIFTASGLCGIATDMVVVGIDNCEIPNVITPNGDGENDYFTTNFAKYYSDVQLTIYNRWGRVVYKTDSYQNDWNGVNMNGNPVSSGTYFYVVSYNNGTQGGSGIVQVIDGK